MLDGLDPFALLDAECTRLAAYFEVMSDEDWSLPSRCESWTRRDMLSHLAMLEAYNRACLDGRVQALLAEAAAEGVTGLNDLNEWGVRKGRMRSTADLLAEWRAANASFRTEMRARGRDGTVDSSIGTYPSWLQAFHLAMEYATHGDDVAVPVSADDAPRRAAWRARASHFAIVEAHKEVALEPRRERYVVLAGGQRAELTDQDFVDATQGRLRADHPLPDPLRRALRTVP